MTKRENIVIVGASSSIGHEIVSRFTSPSTRIIATYRTKGAVKPGENVVHLRLDLEKDKSIERFVEKVKPAMAHIDTLIFLSGIIPGKDLNDYNIADMEKVMTVNFTGQAKVIKGLLPVLDSGSHIIMTSSISAQRGSYDPVYAASKGAILSFVKSIAAGLGGVRVNAIAPGLIEDSTMYNDMSEDRREMHRSQTVNKELLTISDLSRIIYDISRGHWKSLNGACIDLNAGQYVR